MACGGPAGAAKRPRKRVSAARPRPQAPSEPNQVWSYDFVFDHCANGQQLKCLTVTDEFTKEGLAIDVDGRIRSPRVIEVLSRLVSERGAPIFLRSDNGPEFVSKALLSWIVAQGIDTALIERSSPAFEPRLSHAERVRGSTSKRSFPSCNGPGRCGTGASAPRPVAQIRPERGTWSNQGTPSQANRGPKKLGRSYGRHPWQSKS